MVKILAERPKKLKNRVAWMEPIEEILKRESIDRANKSDWNGKIKTWDEVLAEKRRDSHYPYVLDSLKEHGFVRPLTCTMPDGGKYEDYQFGDGHHRLAAAVELGMTHVPLQYIDDNWDCVSADSGDWHEGRKIAKQNRSSR